MARGGLSYAGIGFQSATFKAGAGIKALVAAANRDAVVNIPVIISAAETVDLGSTGQTPFGCIDVYEADGHVTVQYAGFREDVPINADTPPTVGRVAAVDGAGALIDNIDGVGIKQQMIKKVTAKATTAGNSTVTITAAGGGTALAAGKEITVALTSEEATTTINAGEIRAALAADDDVKAYFDVGGTGATITLTRKVATVSEVMAFDFALVAGEGGAVGTTMGNTTIIDGVPDTQAKAPVFVNVDTTAKTATVFLG